MFTFLWWAVILARSGGARTVTTSLFDAQGTPFKVGTMELCDGCFSLLSESKLNEAKAAGVVRVRVAHDVSVLDFSKFLKGTNELIISNARGNAGDEEIGARILRAGVRNIASRVLSWSTCLC